METATVTMTAVAAVAVTPMEAVVAAAVAVAVAPAVTTIGRMKPTAPGASSRRGKNCSVEFLRSVFIDRSKLTKGVTLLSGPQFDRTIAEGQHFNLGGGVSEV
jgi:hypothetical protein